MASELSKMRSGNVAGVYVVQYKIKTGVVLHMSTYALMQYRVVMSQNMNMSVGVAAIAGWSQECICIPFVRSAPFNLRSYFRNLHFLGWNVDRHCQHHLKTSVYT